MLLHNCVKLFLRKGVVECVSAAVLLNDESLGMCLHECVFGFCQSVCVRLTVQAFTVVLHEHREGETWQQFRIKVKTNNNERNISC